MELDEVVVRRELGPGDVDAIVDLHDRVYRTEYGAGEVWVQAIRSAIEQAVRRGWPRERALGSVWLVERDGRLVGSLALVLSARASATSTGSCSMPTGAGGGSVGSLSAN